MKRMAMRKKFMKQDQKNAKKNGEEPTDQCFVCDEYFDLNGWLRADEEYAEMFDGMCNGYEKLDIDGSDVCPCCIEKIMPKNWKEILDAKEEEEDDSK